MNIRKLLALILITFIVIIAAISLWQERAPVKEIDKAFLFPQLIDNINSVKIVEIKGYEEDVIISHQNADWVIQSSDSFPALTEKIKTLIISLSELKIDSEKTKNPGLYSRLAVEGPYDRSTTSKLVTLLDENGTLITSLIVGKEREGNKALPALYVRLPDEEQALLVQGQIELSSKDIDWFQRDIINLSSDEVKSVSITHPNQNPFTLSREDKGQVNFFLQDLPDGKNPQSEVILNRMGRILEGVRANGVQSLNSFDLSDNSILARIETFRGLITEIKLREDVGKYYANFNFSYQTLENDSQKESVSEDQQQPNSAEEVELLNQHISPWVFEIAKFKYDDMTMELENLMRD